MRADAAEFYRRWWPVALRYARRWSAVPEDAEDSAATALVSVMETSPEAMSDREVGRRLLREITRARAAARRPPVGLPGGPVGDPGSEIDAAALDRVTRALGPGGMAAFTAPAAGSPGSAPATLSSRRFRARRRAAEAALAVDAGPGPGCAAAAPLIVRAARRRTTPEQQARLLAHIQDCARCEELLIDRRAVAHRWRIAGAVPVIGLAGRRLVRRASGLVGAHPLAATALAVGAAAAALTGALLAPTHVSPERSALAPPGAGVPAPLPSVPVTVPTVSAAPAPTTVATTPVPTTTTTAPGPTPAPVAVSTVVYGLQADAVTMSSPTGGVLVDVQAWVTDDAAPLPGDLVSVSAPGCSSGAGTTDAAGQVTARLTCTPVGGSIDLTVVEQHGATVTVVANAP